MLSPTKYEDFGTVMPSFVYGETIGFIVMEL
jgi:hypothetical protein